MFKSLVCNVVCTLYILEHVDYHTNRPTFRKVKTEVICSEGGSDKEAGLSMWEFIPTENTGSTRQQNIKECWSLSNNFGHSRMHFRNVGSYIRTLKTGVQESRAPICPGEYILYGSAEYFWVLTTELLSCQPDEAYNFDVAPRFW